MALEKRDAAKDVDLEALSPDPAELHWIIAGRQAAHACCQKHIHYLQPTLIILLIAGYFVYLGFAINYNFEYAKALVVITPLVIAMLIYVWIRDNHGDKIQRAVCNPLERWITRNEHWLT